MPWKVWKSPQDKKWYFHVTADNNEIIAQSEGYGRQRDAAKALGELEYQMLESMMIGKRHERAMRKVASDPIARAKLIEQNKKAWEQNSGHSSTEN